VTTRRILVADDNQQIRLLVGAALRSLGHEIVQAVDGEDALQKAISERPDLVLLDVTMPKLDGFEVLRFLHKQPETANVKVIMLTTAAQQDDLKHGADLGCDEYLTKPFDPKALRVVVEKVLAELES
jgi:CheY-like chemotaxis protein